MRLKWWERLNRALYPYMGPAQLGAGHPEEPFVAQRDPACPVCGRPLAAHVIERGTQARATRLICPV